MAVEIIDSKLCPSCNKAYTYLKYKYEASELVGGYVASCILFLFGLAVVFFNLLVGIILFLSSISMFRTATGVVASKDKTYYWFCYKCDVEFHDSRLTGKTIYHSKKPTKYEMLSQSVQKGMQRMDEKKKKKKKKNDLEE